MTKGAAKEGGDRAAGRGAAWMPARAMVLAAGLGLRMRPITSKVPKPLVKVSGRTLIDRIIDRFEEVGIETVVVNVHHLGQQIEAHLAGRGSPEMRFSPEETLLETGGGVHHALPLLGDEPFFVANADTLWLNGVQPALARLARTWDEGRMDGLLMLHSTVDAYGYQGLGDFCIDLEGALTRRPECEVSPYLFTGVQLLHPRLFKGAPEGAFSLNVLYDRAIAAGRLFGMVHDGEWFHVGTPEGLAQAESFVQDPYPETRHR